MPDGEVEFWVHRRGSGRAGTRVLAEVVGVTGFVALLIASLVLAAAGELVGAAVALGTAALVAVALLRASRVRWRRGIERVETGRWVLVEANRSTRFEVRPVGWGWSFEHDGERFFAVQTGSDTLVVRGMNAARVREIVATLEIDPVRRRVGGAVERSPHAPVTVAVLIAVCAVVLLLEPFASAPFALGAVLVGVVMGRVLDDALFGGRRAEVGHDGIAVTACMRRRFVPFDEIASARTGDGIVEVSLLDGTVLRIHCAPQARRQGRLGRGVAGALLASAARGQAHALAGWIADGVVRARAFGGEDPQVYRAFQRGDRSLEVWRRSLAGAGPYRQGELSRESAERVFDNPYAPPGARIGAALVLLDGGGAEARSQVLAVADASAQLDLAAALRALAAGDPDQTNASLERLLRAVERRS